MSAIHLSQPRATVQARLPDGRVFEAPPGTPRQMTEVLLKFRDYGRSRRA